MRLRAADCRPYDKPFCLPSKGRQKGVNILAPLAKGDSPQCGEMSRSDRGDGRQSGGSGVAAGGIAPEAKM